MDDLLKKLSDCIEFGKINKEATYPPQMVGMDGADELTIKAIDEGIDPNQILHKGLVEGMKRIGIKFRDNKVFVPEVLMAAKAMSQAMTHLKPFFSSGTVERKGKFIVGTVKGDLHDIGKKIVSMMVEGAGWEVIDLGANVDDKMFIDKLEENAGAVVGLSALLTTTMVNMKETVSIIKERYPETKVLIGGAPVNDKFRQEIGADFYSPDPHGAVEYLDSL